jgi:pyruvate,water dikinase
MAVLIQKMIPSQSSGIAFTGEQIVVESVWGLGTALVGGTATPDRYILDRDGKTLLDEHIAPKSTACYLREQGGIIEKSVPEPLQNQPVLDAETRNHLCDLCIRVEQLFECSQDIEWAIVDGNIIILQARPITVSPSPEIWSRANIGEMQPGYVTYLSRIPENRPDFYVQSLKPLLECFNISEEIPDLTFTKYIYGHIYANMTTTYETVGKIPGLSPDIIAQSIGLSNGETSGLTPGPLEMIRMLPGALRVMKFMIDLPKKAHEVMPYSLELISQINTMNLEEHPLHELDTLVWEVYDRNAEVVPIHVCTFMAIMAFYNIVEKILHNIGEPKETTIALISGLEGMCTSQMGIEIWKLAQTASQSPLVTEIISSGEQDILQSLKDHAESTHFLEQVEKFMEDYGDRCSQELELSVPRWKETPGIVLTMVANTLHSNAPNPLTQIEIQKTHRLETQDHILKQLSKNPAEKILFSKILEKIQHYLLVREQLKTTWVKGNTAMRMIYLTMARKLTEKGALSTPHDIFFLKMTEVSDVIAGTLPYDEIPLLIDQRRVEKEACENLDVPDEIIGEPPPLEELRRTIQGGTHFEGIGCSPGIVTGKARVIKDIHQACDIEKGEILVIPVTDPGWSPLFVAASGIIVELGGTLSHGVIIAREYGVPTIVGIKNATDIFHTGQLITIDGGKGLVSVEDEFHD